MSNFKVKPQLPTTENLRKRGDVLEALGYRSGASNGPLAIYDNISQAPDASKLPDGTPVLVRSAGDLVFHITDGGSYKTLA